MLHNTDKDPENLYMNYKSRMQIENLIDVFKNILVADSSYMQNEQAWKHGCSIIILPSTGIIGFTNF